jgi:hypothetical protein
MQLGTARLCLDCDEVHEQERCPVCASEAFAFLTRWVPADERHHRPRPPAAPADPPASRIARVMKGGIVGVAAVGLARLLWQSKRPSDPKHDSPSEDR